MPPSSISTFPWASVSAEISQLSVQPRPKGPTVNRPESDCWNWRTKVSGRPGAGKLASTTVARVWLVKVPAALLNSKESSRATSGVGSPSWPR